jgi:hypothetical protein
MCFNIETTPVKLRNCNNSKEMILNIENTDYKNARPRKKSEFYISTLNCL